MEQFAPPLRVVKILLVVSWLQKISLHDPENSHAIFVGLQLNPDTKVGLDQAIVMVQHDAIEVFVLSRLKTKSYHERLVRDDLGIAWLIPDCYSSGDRLQKTCCPDLFPTDKNFHSRF